MRGPFSEMSSVNATTSPTPSACRSLFILVINAGEKAEPGSLYTCVLALLRLTLSGDVASRLRRRLATTAKENDNHMTMDHSRRGLLRVATLAGLSTLILPGTTLLPVAQAADLKPVPPPAAVTHNGWLLRSSDR